MVSCQISLMELADSVLLNFFFCIDSASERKSLDFAIMCKISKTKRPSFRMCYVSSVHCSWDRKRKIVFFFFIFYVFLEMEKIAKTFGIIRNTFWNAHIEWEVSNYRVIQNPLSFENSDFFYHTALSSYWSTPSLSLKSSTCW